MTEAVKIIGPHSFHFTNLDPVDFEQYFRQRHRNEFHAFIPSIEITFRAKMELEQNQSLDSYKIHGAKSNDNYYKTIWKFIHARGGADKLMANAATHP